jgi:hypothetical protein
MAQKTSFNWRHQLSSFKFENVLKILYNFKIPNIECLNSTQTTSDIKILDHYSSGAEKSSRKILSTPRDSREMYFALNMFLIASYEIWNSIGFTSEN